jgi:N-acetylglucosaminyl-diphospho-decaprenol L-rhamnosyltransferase
VPRRRGRLGWDESYFLHSEETDLSLRARDRGWATYYEPAARALHHGKRSGYDDRIHSMQIVNRVRLYSRRHGGAASWAYYGLNVLGELSWLARGNTESRASLQALLRPGRRPPEIGCSGRLLPT